jgi:ABC-2 type transport system permease protein
MRYTKAWIIASKDLKIFLKKKSILYAIIGFEILVSVGLPLIIRFVLAKVRGIPEVVLFGLINSFSFWYVIGAAVLPMAIASYSLIGEKVQKSLEPLLATPTTDEEILAGKGLAAFVPSMAATYIGATVFMMLVNSFTLERLTYYYFPNVSIVIILFLLAPLSCILSVELNVLVSSRSKDVRAAQQMGLFIFLPFGAISFLTEINVIALTIRNLFLMAAVLAVLDVAVFYIVKTTFRREEILTKWK